MAFVLTMAIVPTIAIINPVAIIFIEAVSLMLIDAIGPMRPTEMAARPRRVEGRLHQGQITSGSRPEPAGGRGRYGLSCS